MFQTSMVKTLLRDMIRNEAPKYLTIHGVCSEAIESYYVLDTYNNILIKQSGYFKVIKASRVGHIYQMCNLKILG